MICLSMLSEWLSPVSWGMPSLWAVRHNAPECRSKEQHSIQLGRLPANCSSVKYGHK